MKWIRKLLHNHNWQYIKLIKSYVDVDFWGKKRKYSDWTIQCTKCGETSVATTVGEII